MTEIANLNTHSTHALRFSVQLTPQTSRRNRRRFFGDMRKALAQKRYALSHSQEYCIAIPLQEQSPRAGRHCVVNWLISQQELSKVVLHAPCLINDLLNDASGLACQSASDQDSSSADDARVGRALHALIRRMTEGALVHALRRQQRQTQRAPRVED